MNLESIVSKQVIVGSIDDSIQTIANIMAEYDIGFVPIAKDNQIIGVITDRDICIRCCKNGISLDQSITDYITRRVISIDIHNQSQTAIQLMGQEKIKRLLVTDGKVVVGIVSLSDFLHEKLDIRILLENLRRIYQVNKNYQDKNVKVDTFLL